MTLFPVPAEIIVQRACKKTPDATVIVTLYNYHHFLAECLESISAQTQANLELIIIDDASTDAGQALAASWLTTNGDALSGYSLLAHQRNMGVALARNACFELASAERVFVMDADNALYPRAIERCMQAMDASGAAGAYTQLEYFGDRIGISSATFWNRDLFKPRNYIDAMALVSKAAWKTVGGYTQLCVDGAEDYDFWCKFVEGGLHCTFVPEILCRYRVHDRSMTNSDATTNAPALVLELSVRHPWLELTHFRHST